MIAGNVLLVQIDLLEQAREELARVEVRLVLPEELAPVDDAPVAQVEQVHGHQRRLGVVGEDVGVVARAAAIFCCSSSSSTVAIRSRSAAASSKRISLRTPPPCARAVVGQVPVPAFQEQPHVAAPPGVGLIGGEPFDARAQAAVDVVLQAGLRVVARQIHLAGRHQKMAVDEVHQAVRQVAGEVRAEVGGAVLAQPPRHVDARILLAGQLDVGIGLVVAQQDVEARLLLLDQVVLKRQRFFFVVDQDVVDVRALPRIRVPVLASARRSSEK